MGARARGAALELELPTAMWGVLCAARAQQQAGRQDAGGKGEGLCGAIHDGNI
jgi:hypothetical protein